MAAPIELYYWPGLPGRGEFVRLLLEDQNYPYVDVARGDEKKGQGMPALMKLLEGEGTDTPSFAPPFIRDGDRVIGQTSVVMDYLAPKVGLAPKDDKGKTYARQIQMTIMDVVEQVHSTHHPVDFNGWYKDQKEEAKRNAQLFCTNRIPKYLNWFEKVITKGGSNYLLGDTLTYVDISLFYLMQGLHFSFPKATARAVATTPKVQALYELVGQRPNIKSYLASNRRVAFGNGIFRADSAAELDF